MKTILTSSALSLIFLAWGACNTSKHKARKHSREQISQSLQTEDRSQESEVISGNSRLSYLHDELFEVSIFPTDSFRFSVQQGFQGKASELRVKRQIRESANKHDSLIMTKTAEVQHTSGEKLRSTKESKSITRELERSKRLWTWFIVAALVVLVVLILRGRIFKHLFIHSKS